MEGPKDTPGTLLVTNGPLSNKDNVQPARVAKRSRFGRVHVLRLPISGERVRARRPSTFSLVAAGTLPAELTTLVWKLFGSGKQVTELLEEAKNLTDYTKLVERMLPHVLVDPRVADESDCEPGADGVLTGTVALVDLPDLDKNHLFMFGVGAVRAEDEIQDQSEVVAADLATFPGEPAPGDAGPGGEAVRAAAEPAGGPRPE